MRKIKQKKKAIRQNKRVQHYRGNILLISIVILLLVIVVSVNGVSLRAKNRALNQREIELQIQIGEEKKCANEMDKYKSYVESKEYIEDVAKNKLGLVYPNEIIFKSKN